MDLVKRVIIIVALAGAACSGGDKTTGPAPVQQAPTMSLLAGDEQTARVNTSVTIPPAVQVRSVSGQGVSGVTVNFAVESGGGILSNSTATTDANGFARVGGWTLGKSAGENTVVATAVGIPGSIRFRAHARLPYWTVLVYMAADNNLALQGVYDIDEMERSLNNPEVQVVVQAEFSPTHLRTAGCFVATCINRPNFNTFRYAIDGSGQNVIGPNGSAIDIGNRRMTDPLQIREFVQWGKQNYPAERYAVVLWNHGGGYTGLLEDLTSSGGDPMSIGDLPTAFASIGHIDVLAFDMCLMAGYETLAKVVGLADYAVFSEEVSPGPGFPYDRTLDALKANPSQSGAQFAAAIAEQYHASYSSDRASTTISAYDVSAFSALDGALGALANSLRSNISQVAPVVANVAAQTQSYTYPELKDLNDLLEKIRARVTDPGVLTQVDAVRAILVGSGRIRNYARRGTARESNDVSRSAGLNIVLPSGRGTDRLADRGPRSFTAYQALYAAKPWTQFLASYLQASSTANYVDQGSSRLENYLVWDSASVRLNVDVDIWVLEPSGNLYIPFLGTVTPNGLLTGDSYSSKTFYEGYVTNRYIQTGRYKIYASLFQDPTNHQPLFDIIYRSGANNEFSSLYSARYPHLSLQKSWKSDPGATFTRIEQGIYTDLVYAAYFDARAGGFKLAAPSSTVALRSTERFNEPSITGAQLDRVRKWLAKPRTSSNRKTESSRNLHPIPRP